MIHGKLIVYVVVVRLELLLGSVDGGRCLSR